MIMLVPVSVVLFQNRGVAPPREIDVNDPAATSYWAGRFNVSQDRLFAAIGEVGGSVAAVRRYLGK
ncbi:MAG TPA: DUF3606 domain-containing protein [Xanthobacteraceae bacterium]|nr:DUF3606 domain-containing protein [Xanthobacteraceae bacterium]